MRNLLLMDTSVLQSSLLLCWNGQLFEKRGNAGQVQGHDHFCFQALSELYEECHCDWNKIDAFGVCIGPGRFNGVRVSCSIIGTFMSLLRKPAYICSSFDILQAQNESDKTISGYAIFAKKGFAYYQSSDFSKQPGLKAIETLPYETHVLEIEGDFIQRSERLSLHTMLFLIEQGLLRKIDTAIEIEPLYCALI